jgi:5-methylcytosine-specific restriction endonuclease McrA
MTGYAWAIDHMIPLERGGAHAWYNIQVIPARLNSWKADRLVLTQPGEWVGMLPGAHGSLFNP